MHERSNPITDHEIREIAQATGADPRTIVRRLAGLSVRGGVRTAIDRELADRGIDLAARGAGISMLK